MPTNQRVVPHELLVDRTDAGAAVRRHDDEAFAAQLLQSFPDGVGGRAHAACKLGHLEALVRFDAPVNDVVPQAVVDRGAVVFVLTLGSSLSNMGDRSHENVSLFTLRTLAKGEPS
jgi:hypothetical protein